DPARARGEPRRRRVADRGRRSPPGGSGDRARRRDRPGRHSPACGAAVRSPRGRSPDVPRRRGPAHARLAAGELSPRAPGGAARSADGPEVRMIQLKSLDKSVSQGNGRLFILRQVSVEIAAGEFVSIMGPSGAGKSTLLAVLGMLDAVASAVIHKPSLILADEPTGNLRSSQGKEIMELFTQLNRAGTTIVQVTHSDVNAQYGNRIVQLRDGWVVT